MFSLFLQKNKHTICPYVQHPLCAACQFVKQKRTTPSMHTTRKVKFSGGLSDNINKPGQQVSCDLYCSSTGIYSPHTFGKEALDKQYTRGALFIIHSYKFILNFHQLSITESELFISRHYLESFCPPDGIKIKQYVAEVEMSILWKQIIYQQMSVP